MAWRMVCKFVLCFVNVAVLLLGISVAIVGLFMYAALDGARLTTALIAIGTSLALLSVVGFCGATMRYNLCLVTYIMCICILIVMQVSLVILEYPKLKSILDSKFGIDDLSRGGTPITSSVQEFLMITQSRMDCCGINGTRDWVDSPWWNTRSRADLGVPNSCCKKPGDWDVPDTGGSGVRSRRGFRKSAQHRGEASVTERLDLCNQLEPGSNDVLLRPGRVHSKGCLQVMTQWLNHHLSIVAGAFFGLLGLQVLAAAAALYLVRAASATGSR